MDHSRRFDPRAASGGGGETRTLGELFRALSTDATRLVRQEVVLARAEMRQNVRGLVRDLARAAVWGVVAAVGGLALVAFLVALLGDLLGSYWLGALLVGALFTLAGGATALGAARRLGARQVQPRETLSSLRETGAWAQTQAEGLRTALAGRPHGNGRHADGNARPRALPAPARGALPPASPREPAPARGGGEPGGGAEEEESGRGFLKRLWHEVQEDDVMGQAAKVAYFAFLSLPPALLVIFGLTGLFGGETVADWLTGKLMVMLPQDAAGIVRGFVDDVARSEAPGPLSIGLVLALWAASTVFVALADALNRAYDLEEDRSWWKRRALALGVMLVFAVFVLVASVGLLAGPEIAAAVGLGGVWDYLFWPVAFLLVVAAFWVIYYVLPNRDQSRDKGVILRGAVIGALLWVLATGAFRLYVANFGSYSETYGFLGAFIVLLLWMYVTGLAVLLGGEINSQIRW